MTIGKINEAQAKEFAYAFIGVIPDYIERHKREYLDYLEETGQYDPFYKYTDTEAAAK